MSKVKQWLNIISLKGKGKAFLKTFLKDTDSSFPFKNLVTDVFFKGRKIAVMESRPVFGKLHARVMGTDVLESSFTRQGISSAMMRSQMQRLSSMGKTHLRSDNIQHVAQIKIREKMKTKFIGYGLGSYQDQSAIINKARASSIVKLSYLGKSQASVRASTVIPKDINKMVKTNLKYKTRFVRIRGRIIPIRTKLNE